MHHSEQNSASGLRKLTGFRPALTLATLALTTGLATPAYAQCVGATPGTTNCSGANGAQQNVTGTGAATIVTTPGFSVNTADPVGLNVNIAGTMSYTDAHASSLRGAQRGLGISISDTAINPGYGSIIVDTAGAITGGTTGFFSDNRERGTTDVTLRGAVTGMNGAGIEMNAEPRMTADTFYGPTHTRLVAEGPVSGATYGIRMIHLTSGEARITSSGGVLSSAGDAIRLRSGYTPGPFNTLQATEAVVTTTGTVRGYLSGILIEHSGTGSVIVNSSGLVEGVTRNGIAVVTLGGGNPVPAGAPLRDVDITTNGVVKGATYGISAVHNGPGALRIASAGLVEGGLVGINVESSPIATSISINAENVTGGQYGVLVANRTGAPVTITTTGDVAGGRKAGVDGGGIVASSRNGTISVQAHNVTALNSGDAISAKNSGSGGVSVKSTGLLSALGNGVFASVTNLGTGPVSIDVNAIYAAEGSGIRMTNDGTGTTIVTARGLVDSFRTGLSIQSGSRSDSVTVNAVDVRGSRGDGGAFSPSNAIAVRHLGTGNIAITSTGSLFGTGGVRAENSLIGGEIMIGVNNVTSRGGSAIEVVNKGTGPTGITIAGLIEGTSAVEVTSSGGQATNIFNNGTIAGNILVSGNGPGQVTNNGILRGQEYRFGTGDYAVVNNGRIVAVPGTTIFSNLDRLQNNGTITMANQVGGDRITADAAVSFTAGSVFAVDVGGAGTDLMETSGAVVIAPGATLEAQASGTLVPNMRYTVLTAGGGLSGEFRFQPQQTSAFTGTRAGYTATSVYIELAQIRALASAGLTPNQVASATGVDSLPASSAVKAAVLMLPDAAAARAAFDQLSGEFYPSALTVAIEDSRLPRNAVLNRLETGNRAMWGQFFGDWGSYGGDRNTADIDRNSRGLIAGIDTAVGSDATIGIAGSYLDSDIDIADRFSNGSTKAIHLLGYGGLNAGAFSLKAGLGYGWLDGKSRRDIAFAGYSDRLTGKYDGTIFQGFAEAGYRLSLGGGHVQPFANLALIRARIGGFTEKGGSAALSMHKLKDDATLSTAGLRFGAQSAVVRVSGSIGWQHSFGDVDPAARFAFSGGDDFAVRGVARSRNAALVTAGLGFALASNVEVTADYDGVLGDNGEDHALKVGALIRF